jgi:hypothetical protein
MSKIKRKLFPLFFLTPLMVMPPFKGWLYRELQLCNTILLENHTSHNDFQFRVLSFKCLMRLMVTNKIQICFQVHKFRCEMLVCSIYFQGIQFFCATLRAKHKLLVMIKSSTITNVFSKKNQLNKNLQILY